MNASIDKATSTVMKISMYLSATQEFEDVCIRYSEVTNSTELYPIKDLLKQLPEFVIVAPRAGITNLGY